MALTKSGELYTWGNGYQRQKPVTGHGHLEDILIPTSVPELADKVVVSVSSTYLRVSVLV